MRHSSKARKNLCHQDRWIRVAKAFQTTEADPKWDPDVDLDNNGMINIVDVTKVAREFGKVDP